jgi:Ca-activated chloride channel family protein
MLSLGLIADFSGSQKDFLRDHRRHLSDFLKHLVGGNDQAFLIGFGNSLRLISPFTTDTDRLTDRLVRYQKEDEPEHFPRVGPPENRLGGTAFYDAIYHASEDLLSTADAGRRALIVFSDGEDNASAHHMLDAIEAAQRAGAMIYCLRYSEIKGGRWNSRNKYGRAVMERIAKETGGLDFDAGESRTLHAAFREITDILRAAYDLAYKSSHEDPESGFRKIQLRGKQPGLTFRHKAGYYAKPF